MTIPEYSLVDQAHLRARTGCFKHRDADTFNIRSPQAHVPHRCQIPGSGYSIEGIDAVRSDYKYVNLTPFSLLAKKVPAASFGHRSAGYERRYAI